MNIVSFTVVAVLITLSPTSALKCRNEYMRKSEKRSTPYGYCWFYLPGFRPIKDALDVCNRMFQGRLPAVNTAEKAGKMAEFITLEAAMYERREMGSNWSTFFRNGNHGTTVWISPQHPTGAEMTWNQTDYMVSFQHQKHGQPHRVKGATCVVFNAETSTWKFVGCGPNITYPLLCEEADHGNNVGDEGTLDPPPTTADPAAVADRVADILGSTRDDHPPTTAETAAVAERVADILASTRDEDNDQEDSGACPDGFHLFEGYCFKLDTGSGNYFRLAKRFCMERGAHLVRINDVNKQTVVREFLTKHLNPESDGAFLDAVNPHGPDLVWATNRASAAYVKASLRGPIIRGPRPIFFTRPSEADGGRIRYCPRPTRGRKCKRTALCETTPYREKEEGGKR